MHNGTGKTFSIYRLDSTQRLWAVKETTFIIFIIYMDNA